MRDLKDLFGQIHQRSLWQVLGVYLAGGWVVLEVVSTFQQEGLAPEWAFRLAFGLLLIGLPIVLVTAYVQKGLHTRSADERRGLGRIFTWRNALTGGVLAFALWGIVSAAWLLSGGRVEATPETPGELTGIAVMPFQLGAAGDGLESWVEGIPSLLATNLDGVGGLRKVDPRSVHTLWRREVGRESVDREAVLDLAREVGAAYAVEGDIVGTPDRLVLTAEVYDVASREPRGPRVRVDGPADSLLALVDRLSVEILRAGLIPADAELPDFDLTRATTPSVEALRAFMDGEVDYRRARFREAIEHFNRAVEIDSTFPLALYRLATSHAWEGRLELAAEYAERAHAHADRLPRREARAIEAYLALSRGEEEALDILEDFTRRYPDDVEGWFLLGDAYFHLGWARLAPLQRFREATRKAIERNPYFGPPYIHLIDQAFHDRDREGVLELVDQYADIDRDTDWCIGYQVAAGLAYGDSAYRNRTLAALDTVSADPLVCAQRALVMTPATWEAYEVAWEEQLTRESFVPPFRGDARSFRSGGTAQRGQIREAVDWLEVRFGNEPRMGNIQFYLVWYLSGYREERIRDWAGRLDRGAATDPDSRVLLALLAGDEDRDEDVRRHVDALRSLADSVRSVSDSARLGIRTADDLSALAEATLAAVALRRSPDDPAVLERAIEALFEISAGEVFASWIMRYDIGRALVDGGRFEDARPYFESFTHEAGLYAAPKEYWLGRIAEGLGDVEEARRHYGNFVTWWEDADPQFHAWREEARERLARLLERPPAD